MISKIAHASLTTKQAKYSFISLTLLGLDILSISLSQRLKRERMADHMLSNIHFEMMSFINQLSKRVTKRYIVSFTTRRLNKLPRAVIFFLSVFMATFVQADPIEVFMNEGDTSFELSIPATLPHGNGESTLSIEFAGYDISSFAQIKQNVLYVDLGVPVDPGKHTLQVLLFWSNGDIEQIASGNVVVRPSSSNTTWKVNTLFSPQYRIDEKNVDQGDQDALTSTGSIDAQAIKTIDNWQLEANLLAMYDTVNENDENFNEWALAQFKLASRYNSESVQGEISVGDGVNHRESLLFSSFQRRGLAAAIGSSNQAYQLQVFDVRADPTTRYDGNLIADNTDDRAIGIQASAALLDDYLGLTIGFVDGKTDLSSANEQGLVFGGDSWNMALDSYFLEESLWLHTEYAESNFDNDGMDHGKSAQKDHAFQTMLQLSSGNLDWFSWMEYWSGYLQYQEVGKDFYSIGNMSLPGDLKLMQVYFQTSIQSVSFDLEFSEEENNLDKNPTLATQILKRITSNISYQPSIDPSNSLWQLLGVPSGYLSLSYQDHSQAFSDSQKVGFDLNNQTSDSSIGINFNNDTWRWGLSYQYILQQDKSREITQGLELLYAPPSDLKTDIWGAQASWVPNDRISLNTYLQWNIQSETDFSYDYINQNIGVDGTFALMPQILSLSMNINLTDDTSDLGNSGFDEDDRSSLYTGAQLTWHAMTKNSNNTLLDVYLRGNYGKQDDHLFDQSDEQWAVYLGTELQWSVGGI